MSCRDYVPHCKRFELKLGMRREESLLTNFPKFHGDCITNAMFSQHCCKTYLTDLVYFNTERKFDIAFTFTNLEIFLIK